MVERFGKFNRFAFPGFNWVLCCIGDIVAGDISLRIRELEVRCETKTRDNVFVTLIVSVQYTVSMESDVDDVSLEMGGPQTGSSGGGYGNTGGGYVPLGSTRQSGDKVNTARMYDSFYRLTEPRKQICSFVFDVVRATVPKMALDEVFEAKRGIATSVQTELAKAMRDFGYSIVHTLIVDIEPDPKVKAAMNEINAAQRMRMAASEKAEAEKIRVVKAAEADAEAKYLEGQGIARQRAAIITGLRDSVTQFSEEIHGVNNAEVVRMMLTTQYIDMLQKVGLSDKNTTLFLNHNPAALTDIESSMRNGMLSAEAARPRLVSEPTRHEVMRR